MEELFQKRDVVTHALESATGLGAAQLIERGCQITVLNGSCANQVFEIKGASLRVGKGTDSDIRLTDPTVSREHFVLTQEAGSFLIRDLGSTNGTWVDQMRIREAYLRPGSVIKAGDVQLRFEPLFRPVEVAPSEQTHFGKLVGRSLAMRQIFSLLERVCGTEATVIILGETGTGKGAVARAIHEQSSRKDKPFVVFDCGAIAENLIESELFGHEKGAFTGAASQRQGALELAAGGTLFIDELVDLRLDLQPKLLRALEEREFRRLGSNKPLKLDARVIAASKRDLWAEVEAGKFREDLYFRLAVFTIPLPPLRDRIEDVPLLATGMAEELGVDDNARKRLTPKFFARLQTYEWPGNVRELRNALERVFYFGEDSFDPLVGPLGAASHPVGKDAGGGLPNVTAQGRQLNARASGEHPVPTPAGSGARGLPPVAPAAPAQVAPSSRLTPDYDLPFKVAKEKLLEQFEAEYMLRLLERCKWQISNAAREAGIDRKHMYNLMKKYNIEQDSSKG